VKKRLLIPFILVVLVFALAATTQIGAAPKITLRITDNIPDRNSPWGQVIVDINNKFMKAHPGVEIVTESYQDQTYQQKMKIYAASNKLPDVFKYWSFSSLMGPLAENGYLMPLNAKNYTKMGFIPGSLDANRVNGKLYGLPVTTDFWVIYYNKALFTKYNVKVPQTFDELKESAKTFRTNGVIPMVTDGKDAWPLCITFDNILGRMTGNFSPIQKALNRKAKFTDPAFLAAAKKFKELVDAKVFQDDLLTSDYGASRNLFGQEKAAMYLMGSWEMGLATDGAFSDSFKKNVRVMKFPVLNAGKGINDLVAWYGGNYVVSSKSKHKKLCLEYLKTYFSLYPKLIWKHKANIPAQKLSANADDTELSKDLLGILSDAEQTSGTPSLDRSTPEFKETYQKYIQELAAGIKTPEQFVKALDEAAQKAAKK
jgi:raffinose/stachyose/melibiose transport system substrate-binding protein